MIVSAAIAVLDEVGPARFSLRAVAARLGVNANALYTYVADRAALEQLVVEHLLGALDAALLDGPARSWRARVVRYATAFRETLLAHPAAVPLFMTAPMTGPAALLVGERLIATLRDSGLGAADAGRGAYTVIVHTLGSVALEVAETDGRAPLPPEAERLAARHQAAPDLDPAAYPHTSAARDVIADWTSTRQFAWGLNRLLDGLTHA